MNNTLVDEKARAQAIDPRGSFIVQAPAGSGKTELLTQRFLALLTTVDAPEKIVALTFTKKAAREMRERILTTIENSHNNAKSPTSPHQRKSWTLAREVIKHDEKHQWHLLEQPHRLKVQTIDSLCGYLTRSMPLLSQTASHCQISDDPRNLYIKAAQDCIIAITKPGMLYEDACYLLNHLGNHQSRLVELFAQLLSRREQWLGHILFAREQRREHFEHSLASICQHSLDQIEQKLSDELLPEILELARFSAKNVDQGSPIAIHLTDIEQIEYDNVDQGLQRWRALCELLLTKNGEWRKKITKKQGFPAPSSFKSHEEKSLYKNKKESMEALLEKLSEYPALKLALNDFLQLPKTHYSDQQWRTIAALINILPFLAAHLNITFTKYKQIDFNEVSQQALQALGDLDVPTDLALYLDHQIQHLLIDEFQDTSLQQYQLLEKLTAGWQQGDGRTLFVVGDPMQSIYRFRQAEVGLFLKVRQQGLGDIALRSLNLVSNFRSNANIVAWVNQQFSTIFPVESDIANGAVNYHSSQAVRQTFDEQKVFAYALIDEAQQAAEITDLIEKIQQESPNKSVAVLVRSRNHLKTLLPQLTARNIAFQGVDIENLATEPCILDLFSLTKAMLQASDHSAWLSVLRAPWCGLSLADLEIIVTHSGDRTILSTICDENVYPKLSHDGATRLKSVTTTLNYFYLQRQRHALSLWIKQCWQALHAPSYLSESQHKNIEAYWSLLDKYETNGLLPEMRVFEEKMMTLYSNKLSDAPLQIMTIHKSKGLEFDVVIIPNVDKAGALPQTSLLQWCELHQEDGPSELLMAPIKSIEQEQDDVYRYIQYLENKKETHELQRLLYVAVTRTKEQLYLFSTKPVDEATVSKKSFLSMLAQVDFIEQEETNSDEKLKQRSKCIYRLSIDTILQGQDRISSYESRITTPTDLSELKAQDTWKRHCGTFIHECLCLITQKNIGSLEKLSQVNWPSRLNELGVNPIHINDAIELSQQAIRNILSDPRGQWILKDHKDARSEMRIYDNNDGVGQQYIIDRTFIDEDGVRWIIDYKISQRLLGLNAQAINPQYKQQLETYAKLLYKLDKSRPIQLALYYPLTSDWHSWPSANFHCNNS